MTPAEARWNDGTDQQDVRQHRELSRTAFRRSDGRKATDVGAVGSVRALSQECEGYRRTPAYTAGSPGGPAAEIVMLSAHDCAQLGMEAVRLGASERLRRQALSSRTRSSRPPWPARSTHLERVTDPNRWPSRACASSGAVASDWRVRSISSRRFSARHRGRGCRRARTARP